MTRMKHETRVFLVLFAVLFSLMLFFTTSPAHAQTSYIEMTSWDYIISIRLAGSGQAVIDWGEGTPQTVTLNAGQQKFEPPEDISCDGQFTSVTAVNGSITELRCIGNALDTLDVSRALELTELDCGGNDLDTLDVSRALELTELRCYGNDLAELNLSRNTALKVLDCMGNNLRSLDLSRNTALTFLECNRNLLRSLDLSRNTALTELNCSNNFFDADALNALFGTLNSTPGTKTIDIRNNPGAATCDQSIATAKGWTVKS